LGRVSAIEAADDFILTKREKIDKVGQIIERHLQSMPAAEMEKLQKKMEDALKKKFADLADELEKTVVHKIAIEKNHVEYKATGEVKGHVLNQFSMDEHDGYFRIATTKSQEWSRFGDEKPEESYSNLFVLDESMNTVGSVEGLAKGERIYSARFMQNRAYLVTFKQTDPLFVIDLEDPKTPKVLGQLKIPGFSNYLHPYDETTLIGLGKETEETEPGAVRQKGVKLSLFDVSDVSSPKEIDTFTIGESGSDSIAAQDHKAFLFSRERNLLVIPVSLMEKEKQQWAEFTFGGALIFKVDTKGFTLRGRIDHSDSGAPSMEDYWGGYSYYDNTVKRSLYIDDVLYTFSNSYLKANSLDDLRELKKIPFEKEQKNPQIPEPFSHH
ncbi:MAG: beta-propeller domain-containing protein, partial [bacterium]|nr:beta-propeller domain-containing protein [bacterium]